MIWNMNQTKKAYRCKNVKTRTTINWSSCANDGISKDKHFSRLQGHNLLDNNVNLKLKFGQVLLLSGSRSASSCNSSPLPTWVLQKPQHQTQPQTLPLEIFSRLPKTSDADEEQPFYQLPLSWNHSHHHMSHIPPTTLKISRSVNIKLDFVKMMREGWPSVTENEKVRRNHSEHD